MTNLKILGAQRVKALIAMLHKQRDAEIAEEAKTRVSYERAKVEAMHQLGLGDVQDRLEALKVEIKDVSAELLSKTGQHLQLSVRVDSYQSAGYKELTSLIKELQDNGADARIAEIRAEYESKEQLLWLCETLEEAKKIVGME